MSNLQNKCVDAEKLFDQFDTNKNGCVQQTTIPLMLEAYYKSCGEKVSSQCINEQALKFCQNQDGNVTKESFIKCMKCLKGQISCQESKDCSSKACQTNVTCQNKKENECKIEKKAKIDDPMKVSENPNHANFAVGETLPAKETHLQDKNIKA